MIRAVLLDLDGTLVDTVQFILDCVRHTFEGHPRAPTDAQWIAGMGKAIRVQLRELVGDDEAEIERLVQKYRAHQRLHLEARTAPYPGVVDSIAALRAEGRRIAVVTGKLVEPAEWTVRYVGLGPHVELVVGADSCAHCKPHPGPVLHALEALGVPASEAIFVGDSHNDVLAGRAAGALTAGALWGAHEPEALLASRPDHLLRRVEDLPALLSRLDAASGTPGM